MKPGPGTRSGVEIYSWGTETPGSSTGFFKANVIGPLTNQQMVMNNAKTYASIINHERKNTVPHTHDRGAKPKQ